MKYIPLFEEFCASGLINEISAYRAEQAAAKYVHNNRNDKEGLAGIRDKMEREYPNIYNKAFRSDESIDTEFGQVFVSSADNGAVQLIFRDKDEQDLGTFKLNYYNGKVYMHTESEIIGNGETIYFGFDPKDAIKIIGNSDAEITRAVSNILGIDVPEGTILNLLSTAKENRGNWASNIEI